MLTIGWVALGLLATGDRPDGIRAYRDFQVEGIAYSHTFGKQTTPIGLFAGLRLKGRLPSAGPWMLRIVRVENADKDPKSFTQPMHNETIWSPDVPGVSTFSPIQSGHTVNRVRIVGELVHTYPVEEVVDFPQIHLETPSDGKQPRSPAMRLWWLPKGATFAATTPMGLKLQNPKRMSGFGYSGPGYDDMALIPVSVDETTVRKGLERQLRNGRFVDRIEAWPFIDADGNPLYVRPIYSHSEPESWGVFGLVGPQFDPNPKLTFHVVRHVADQWFRFSLAVPVQAGRDLHPESDSPLLPAVWPSEETP